MSLINSLLRFRSLSCLSVSVLSLSLLSHSQSWRVALSILVTFLSLIVFCHNHSSDFSLSFSCSQSTQLKICYSFTAHYSYLSLLSLLSWERQKTRHKPKRIRKHGKTNEQKRNSPNGLLLSVYVSISAITIISSPLLSLCHILAFSLYLFSPQEHKQPTNPPEIALKLFPLLLLFEFLSESLLSFTILSCLSNSPLRSNLSPQSSNSESPQLFHPYFSSPSREYVTCLCHLLVHIASHLAKESVFIGPAF